MTPIIVELQSLSSTQRWGEHLVQWCISQQQAVPFCIILARQQSQGRGRGKHTWYSPGEGKGFYATLVIPIPPPSINALSLKVGIALAKWLNTFHPGIKVAWPNDLVYGGSKLAGILCQILKHTVLVGIGINLNIPQEELKNQGVHDAISLGDLTGVPIPYDAFKTPFITWAQKDLSPALWKGFDPEEWEGWCAWRPGQRLTWQEDQRVHQGIYQGIDEEGKLHVEEGGRKRALIQAEKVRCL